MAISSTTVFRVRGLPSNLSIEGVTGIIERSLGMPSEVSGSSIKSLAQDFYHSAEQVATLSFLKDLPELFITATAATSNEWPVDLLSADYDPRISRSRTLKFDTHFQGLTVLNDPPDLEEAIDCVVVCGLGGHAFGSFKEKGASYMWLRDSLPRDLPNLRVLLYGYESGLVGSESALNVSGIAEAFIGHLRGSRSQHETIPRPLLMIAHSLGGLVVKQAIIKLSRGDESDKQQMQSIMGLLFFGVPNRGMDIASLRAMVGDQPNRYILESIGQYSDLLSEQDVRFGIDFHYRDSPIFSFFETKTSPTALKINGVWRMAGNRKLLVGPFSAKHPRHWEHELHHEPFDRTHSDLVKFSVGDLDYERVRSRLNEIVSKAKRTLITRYLSQESPESLSADEEACLRTLAFTEINAREGRVESAAPDTGDWLLQSQDFQDWAQRKRFDQHHGFFWIQGNPGSGKSTLMKKAYSQIQDLSQDPTSVMAAFFFNARGSEIEKSPAGLFRTLLHSLCQHISALRAAVMKKYHRKRGLLSPNWEWQSFELKELLGSVVTASILGQRNLILCVNALDECDLIGAKSVIQFFEHLANSSIREHTKFNVCLSSRYWPHFTIQHCFKTRVEIENCDDIARYIQQHMATMQAIVNESDPLAILETKIKDKAKGTFLWVVLVVQELLSAHENGATLGELDRILHRVPPDLWSFYQHQMENGGHDDRCQMLSTLQCVFYSLKPITPTELRYLLAFGHESYSSYSEWAQSNEYVMDDAQFEKRIRDKSKGLLEIAELPEQYNKFKRRTDTRKAVQFIHQTVRDFLMKDGFKALRGCEIPNDAASAHEFMKVACFNYLNTKNLQSIPIIDVRLYSDDAIRRKMPTLSKDHPLLEYAVDHLFPHAALAEENGVPQDNLRSHMSDDNQGIFELWKYLIDLISVRRGDRRPGCVDELNVRAVQGAEARPLHVFAQYGLIAPGMMNIKEDPNIQGGLYDYPLLAAAAEGHKDAVRYLLNLGADLQISSLSEETAYHWAIFRGHADLLGMLLEQPRSYNTLEQRFLLANFLGHCDLNSNQVHQITALLIPEVSIRVSAIDQICRLIASNDEPFVSLILDKCEAALLRHKSLLYACVGNHRVGIQVVQRLLDGVETIEICEELLNVLHQRRRDGFDEDQERIAVALFERGEVKMTEEVIDKVMLLRSSSHVLNILAQRGIDIPPLTCQQTMSALSNGSPESVAFFAQHAPVDASSDDLLLAVVQNNFDAAQAVRILLGLQNIDRICEDGLTSSLRNRHYSLSLLKTFEDRWGTMAFSTDTLAIALSSGCASDVIEFVLSRCERFSLTKSLVHVALRKTHMESSANIGLLLEYDPTFRVQDELIAKTLASWYSCEIVRIYIRHGKPLLLTEKAVRAAARHGYIDAAVETLNIIFQNDSDAKISDTMVLEALRSPYGSLLITWMLESDPSICMQEDFLVAAASNTDDGALIFEALHQKGRLCFSNPTVDATQPRPTKRQRVSSDPLLPLRDKGTKSAPITTEVIKAAAANKSKEQRERLLSIFQTWGVLTDEEVELFRFSDEDVASSLSNDRSSAQSDCLMSDHQAEESST